MDTPGGQNPTFWPKMTTNIGIIPRTSLLGPHNNAKQPQIYIQDKIWWYLFKINCITVGVGVISYMDTPGGGVKPHILTKILVLSKELPYLDHLINAKQPQIHIQDKAWWYLLKLIA